MASPGTGTVPIVSAHFRSLLQRRRANLERESSDCSKHAVTKTSCDLQYF